MSREIDTKVVEMMFDNKQFEDGVQESISSLNKLKEALNFDNVGKSFSKIEQLISRVDLSPISDATGQISVKFDALGTVAEAALQRITNSAISTGEQLIKSLSVDNISAGWAKFGEKTTSVGTLFSQGFDMSTVTNQLERLNWYTDETSYNFTDMVSNIAKFTSTGQDLETSVTAMEGIANWAALSGQNANTASRAMYNISQAMGAGSMKLIDYKSIQNASMDTDEFRQKVLDAAVELGTLQKVADDTYKTIEGGKTFKKSQFTSELAKGWFDKDVMMKVFNEYSAAVDDIYDYAIEHGITASEAIEQMGDGIDEFGLKAFKAAQEARTWSDVLDSVKDAVSTGWMNTFENIFGDYEHAKQLWTDLANELYDVFAEGGNQRNDLLKEWNELGGRTKLLEAFWNSFHALTDAINLVKEAFAKIFPQKTALELIQLTDTLMNLTRQFKMSDETAEALSFVLETIFSVLSLGIKTVAAVAKGFYPLIEAVKILAHDFMYVTRPIGLLIQDFDKATKAMHLFDEITYQVSRAVGILATYISGLVANGVVDFFSAFNASGSILEGVLYAVAGSIEHTIDMLIALAAELTGFDLHEFANSFHTAFRDVISFLDASFGAISGMFDAAWNTITGFSAKLSNSGVSKIFAGLSDGIKFAADLIKKALTAITNALANAKLPDVSSVIESAVESITNMDFTVIKNMASNIKTAIGNLISALDINSVGDILKNLASLLQSGFTTLIAKDIWLLIEQIKSFGTTQGVFGALASGFSDAMDAISSSVALFQAKTKANALSNTAKAVAILAASLFVLSAIPADQMAAGLTGLSGAIGLLVLGYKGIAAVNATMDTKTTYSLSISIIALSVSTALLAASLKSLSKIDTADLVKGFGAVWGLIGVVTKASASLSNAAQFTEFAGSLILLAVALNMLIPPMVIFGNMKLESIAKGMFAMVGTMELLSLVLKEMTGSIGATGAMILLAAALNMLIPPMVIFGNMKLESIAKGMFAMVGTMELLSLVLKEMTGSIGATGAMILLAAALNMLIPPMVIFGNMKLESIAKGMFAIVGTMELLSLVLREMTGVASGVLAMTLLAAALNMLIPPMTIFGNMSIDSIGKGIFAMVSTVALLGVAMGTLSGSAGGVGILMIAAVALNMLMPAVLTFSSLRLDQLGMMLLTFASGLGVLVLGLMALSALAAILTPAIPILLSTAAALGIIAVSVALLAPALATLAAVGASVIISIVEGIHVLAQNMEQVVDDISVILYQTAKLILDVIGYIAVGALEGLNDFIGPLLEVIMKLAIQILKVLAEFGDPLIQIVVDTIIDLLKAIASKAGDIVQATIDIVIDVLNGIGDALCDPANAERLREGILNLLNGLFEFTLNFFGINSPSTKMEWVGKMLIEGLRKGILELADALFGDVFSIFTKIHDFFEENVANFPEIFKMGWDTIKGYMTKGYEEIREFLKPALLGANFVQGFADGVTEAKDKAVEAVKDFGTAAVDKLKNLLQIHSPSDITNKIGQYFDVGFGDGVESLSDWAKNKVSGFGENALSGLSGLSSKSYDFGFNSALSWGSGYDDGMKEWAKKSWSTSKEQMMAGADYALNQGYQARQNMIQQEKDKVIDDVVDDPTGIFGEQESDAEKELEAQLNQLEIMYNTGAIATEEEYHKRRLALLENYKGEWTKKSSAWLKAERDWFKKQEENANKASSKSKDNVFTEFGKTIDGVYDKAAEKYDRLLEKYKSGEITAAEYEKKYNKLLISSAFARNKLMQHADEEMKKYATEMLQDISDEYEDKLSDIHSKMESFSESMSGDLRDSFKMKTQSDVQTEAYNNASEDLDIQIRVLQKKRDEAAKLYGESNWYTVKLQKDLDEANKKAERLSQRHQNEQDHLGDEKLMALDDQIAKLEDQRDSIIKLYGSNAAKARELEKQIKDLEKQEDEYLLSEEYRENRKNREKNKDKLDSKIVGVEFTDQLKEDAENLKKYNDELKKLTNRDLAAGFTDILKDMTQEEGLAFAEYLNGLSDDELRTIMSQWEAKKTASRELSETMYAGEVEQATTEFQSKASDILAELPDSGYTAGQKAMKEIGNGFSDAANETLEQCNTTMYDVIDGVFSEANRVRLEDKMRDSWKTALDHTLHEMQWNLDSQSLNIYLHPVIDTTDIGEAMAQSGMKMGIEGSSAYYTQRISAYMNESKVNQVSDIKESIDNNTNATAHWMDALDARFDRLERVYEGLEIVIDENSLADGLAVPMSKRMGRYATMQSRGG